MPSESLTVGLIKTASSNKEYLAYLLLFNSKSSLKFDENDFKNVNLFIGNALQMKNSYVRFQAVDFIGKNLTFKSNHDNLLKVMAVEDKNTHIIERLKEF